MAVLLRDCWNCFWVLAMVWDDLVHSEVEAFCFLLCWCHAIQDNAKVAAYRSISFQRKEWSISVAVFSTSESSWRSFSKKEEEEIQAEAWNILGSLLWAARQYLVCPKLRQEICCLCLLSCNMEKKSARILVNFLLYINFNKYIYAPFGYVLGRK